MLRRLFAALDGPSDAELLGRFAAERDAGAFELLVWRHAGLVFRVCRGALRDHHAAEDAAQATFLALALQAGTVRGENLTGWLFRVALRIAGRSSRKKRKLALVSGLELDRFPVDEQEPDPELQQTLHEEIARLSPKYQIPLLLCFFEGLTHAEAARHLGWPVGTVNGRVARAKEVLARRLVRRGVAPSVLAATAVAVSPSFACSTSRSAAALLNDEPSGISASVLEIAQREATAMFPRYLKVSGFLVVAGMLAFGAVWAADSPVRPPIDPITSVGLPAPVPPVPAAEPPQPVIEKTFAVVPITTDLQRRLLHGGKQQSLAVVFVDGSALFRSPKELDLEALPLDGISKALKAYKRYEDPDKDTSRVHFIVHYSSGADIQKNGSLLLRLGLAELGREAGFGWSNAFESTHPLGFSMIDYTTPLRKEKQTDAAETRIGDDLVHAYPVRTPLSRILTGGADGVIDVRVRLPGNKDDWMPDNVEKSAQKALAGLKLPKGKTVNFRFDIDSKTRVDSTQDRLRELVKRWAADQDLSWSFSH